MASLIRVIRQVFPGKRGLSFPVAWPGNEPHTEMTYDEYLKSDEWDFRSGIFIERVNGQCTQCGAHRNLTVHHKHYGTLGEEDFRDVEVLCWNCHKTRHPNR